MYQIHEQFLDSESGFHVIELRDEQGSRHLVQIAVGADACPACGTVYPKGNLGSLDPAAMVARVNAALNESHQQVLDYAQKHGVRLRKAANS